MNSTRPLRVRNSIRSPEGTRRTPRTFLSIFNGHGYVAQHHKVLDRLDVVAANVAAEDRRRIEEMQNVALLLCLAADRSAAGARQRGLDHARPAERMRHDLLGDLQHGDGADPLVGGEERDAPCR